MSPAARKALVFGLLVIGIMAPIYIGVIAGAGSLAAPWLFGAIISVSAGFISMRLAVILAPVGGIVSTFATMLHPYPIVGSIFLGLVAGAAAYTARRGINSVVLLVPLFASFALVAPPEVSRASTWLQAGVLIGLASMLGGLWSLGVMRVLVGNDMPKKPLTPLSMRGSVSYAIIMGSVIGISAWGVLTWAPSHQGAWLLLTLIVVLQPAPSDTFSKTFNRLGGTLIGVVAAGLISLAITSSAVSLVLSTIFLFVALVLRYVLKKPYWLYMTFLTPSVILIDSHGRDVMDVAAERLAATVLAALIAITIALLVKFAHDRWFMAPPQQAETNAPA